MNLKIYFTLKQPHETYGQIVRGEFGEEDLQEWVQQYVEDSYMGCHTVSNVVVEAIEP